MFKLKRNSLSAKIFLSFFILGILLLTILFLQIIPNLQEEEKKHVVKQINSMIYLINQQLILTSISIKNTGKSRREEIKSIIELEANRITELIQEKNSYEILKNIKNQFNSKKISCNTSIVDKNLNTIYQKKKELFNKIELKPNVFVRLNEKSKYVCPTGLRKIFYTTELQNTNTSLVISCNIDDFKATNLGFEQKLKIDVQKSFSQMEDFHKGKVYLMWLNLKKVKKDKTPLYNKNDDHFYNEKYCLSRISNFKYPKTGLLSGEEILNAVDKEPIRHLLDTPENPGIYNEPTLTWIRKIDSNDNESFLYVTSIYEKDFFHNIDSSLLKILPAAFFSFFIAIILALILFKRLFKSINKLTNTAIGVNKGKTNLRSNIKGDDDIAQLGKAFDNMLDSLEENISELDNKVENKTKQLSASLNEKETLLKEIHHRVKNNLAITINLIKLEKAKINNDETKDSLTNIEERVHAMELLHRKLYESKDLSSISLKKYIEEVLCDLQSSYSNTQKIKILTNIDNKNLNIDYALPCGLIISELVTNSFKYAFKDKGEIKVNIDIEGTICHLCIWDNGIGLEESIDINNTQSLGLQIVSNIANIQLFGKFKYSFENGAKFEVTFDVEEKDL